MEVLTTLPLSQTWPTQTCLFTVKYNAKKVMRYIIKSVFLLSTYTGTSTA